MVARAHFLKRFTTTVDILSSSGPRPITVPATIPMKFWSSLTAFVEVPVLYFVNICKKAPRFARLLLVDCLQSNNHPLRSPAAKSTFWTILSTLSNSWACPISILLGYPSLSPHLQLLPLLSEKYTPGPQVKSLYP